MAKTLTARDVANILEANGFEHVRTNGSHRTYKRIAGEEVFITQISAHRMSEDIPKKSLATIIRQSGLSKKLFR